MLASWFSKSFKLGFSSMWTENFQTYKGRETRDQMANIQWEAREFQKNVYFCYIDYTKASDCVNHNNS